MDEIDDMMRASKVFFIDTSLSSPIIIREIETTKELIDTHISCSSNSEKYANLSYFDKTRVNFFRKLADSRRWSIALLSLMSPLMPEMYPAIEKLMLGTKRSKHLHYAEASESAFEFEDAIAAGLRARGLPAAEVEGTAQALKESPCFDFQDAYEEFCNLFGRAESRTKLSEQMWTHGKVGKVSFWVHSKHALIRTDEHFFYSSLNQVLMLKDKLATRYQMLHHVKPLNLPHTLIKHLYDIFSWQDKCLVHYGNKAYSILKAVEPMFKTRISHTVDNVFGDDTAYNRMIQKMNEKEQKLTSLVHGKQANMIQELHFIVERVESTQELVELFGCQKSCGHPLIDPAKGGLSAAEEARSPDKTSLIDAQRLRNTFCHIVLTSFISQRGAWPKLIFKRDGTILQRLSERQLRNINYNSYPLSDWDHVEWTKMLEMDYYTNFLDLMDDKSISLYRSDKHLSWEHKTKPKSQRRLLLEVLRRKEINIKEIVERVSRRDVPDDWKIVSLYPKEREFKEEPRMFAMLVLEMRCFFTAIEANLADNLFKFLPQQTMTKTKTQNQERFLKFTDPNRKSSFYTLFLEIDLTRWNLKWRELVIHMLGHDINQMFGVKGTYTVTHWFFNLCQILVRVPGMRPEGIELEDPPESSLAWRDHKGGFEGLNQKLWTAATYAMVEMALVPLMQDGTISDYELIGQGDNQVVRLEIPSQDKTREQLLPCVRDKVNEALEATCTSVNQEVKPEENVESTSILTYSKDVYVSGVEYPTSLKKHSRLFPVTSMDFPSISGNTRAILAGAVAGGENAKYPLRSAVVGWYHAYRYLSATSDGFCVHGEDSIKLTAREKKAALVIPSSVGGYAGMAIASFFYKGGSDPLGKEISGLRFLSEGKSELSQICSSALRGLEEKYHINPKPELSILIDNPYGLPLMKPTSPLAKIGHLTLDAFRGQVINREIKPLLTNSVTKAEQILKLDLLKITPLNPILLHDMFDASGFGTIKLMRKMFLHTRTIQSVAQWANPDITHVFLRADKNDTLWFQKWVTGLPKRGFSGKSTFDLVTQFRKYWGVELHGVTSYQPLDFIHQPNNTRSISSIKWSAHSRTDLFTARGPLSGYVGTATREKRSEHGYKIVDTGAPSRSLMKLQLIRSQAYGNDMFNLLVDRIGLTRCATPLSAITDLLPKVVGGSISHRYSSSIRSMSASYVGPLNFVTHIRLDSNNVGQVSGSTLNYPIMMQEFLIMAQAGAKMMHQHHMTPSGQLLIDVPNLTPLPEDSLACELPKFQSAALPKSKLLACKELMLVRTYDKLAQSVPRGCVVPSDQYSNIEKLEEALVYFFSSTLKDQQRAKTLADTRGTASIPARYQLDIAEAHALGPIRILRCVAEAVVVSTIRDTYLTIHLHPERWDESMFLAHNIEVCIKACSSYWSHPLFYSHRDFNRFRSSRLSYGSSSALIKRQTAFVRREISSILTSYDHRFWIHKTPVFSGENAMNILEALTICGAKILYRLRIIGDPRSNLYASLYSSYLRLPSTATRTIDSALDLVRLRVAKLSRAIENEGDIMLANQIQKLSHFSGISVYNDDVRTVLRSARSLQVSTSAIPTAKSLKPLTGFSNPRTKCLSCLPDARSTLSVQWSRYSQRQHGGIVSAGYTWLPVLPEIAPTHNTLIVGSGNGGLADLLLECFDTKVTGLDLDSDMPSDCATLMNYVPVGIQQHNRPKYTQSDFSITTSGDWTNNVVRDNVLQSLDGVSTVYYDATGPSVQQALEAATHALSHPLVSDYYARLIGDVNEVELYLSKVTTKLSRMWVVSRSHVSVEVIVHLTHRKKSLHTCNRHGPLIDIILPASVHDLIPSKRQELIEAATLSCFAWEDESLFEVTKAMNSLCVSLLNKAKHHQLKYHDRMSLILAYSTMFATMNESPIELIQSWIAEDELTTDLFRYKLNQKTITHLLKYVARLSGLVDSSLYMSSH
ncbi:RNA dependent RNA polymerase [Plasmopara viticola lesion associated mononegaambi virus 9]|uniref:RNA-directed RNA polymerase n=1 Tax=Plasmopara viticola lesion associated mononegaambi virus 9 TaxID=2692021 RepID=A0A6B9Q4L4_9MONO|nr:RNA dependent RNA polymerase [Plasmopara viticola lesion associated mononegaambi virus 9]QHD64784.1 RNA dependent RNA polymerase [Plasmopara viticola lesion associated mononegaambi virus 9]